MIKAGLNLMSLFFTVIMTGAFTTCLMAQSVPMGINYQAVARNANGDELINRNIDVRLSIISGSPTGEVEWEEVHSEVTTSQFGLFNIVIGQGIFSNGTISSFEDIPWGDDLHFLKVEVKFDSEYLTMGTMQFLSVPYALYAQKSLEPGPQGPPGPAGDPASDDQVLFYDPQSHILSLENDDNPVDLSGLINDADFDPDNELQILNLKGNELQIKTLSDSTLINTVDIDASPVNEIQYLSIQGYRLSLSQGNFVTLPDSVKDDDADPLNEIQDLHIEGNVLYITRNNDSTRIDLSPYMDNTDGQNLSLIRNFLSIDNGNTVALNYNDTSATNELQVLSISNDTIYLTNGGYVKLPQDNVDDADPDPGNEIQDLSLIDDTLKITNNPAATDIDLSVYLDNTDQQNLDLIDNLLTIDNGDTVALNYNDTSATNELITNFTFDSTYLEITDAGGTTIVDLSSLENIPLIGFRAEKLSGETVPSLTDTTLIFEYEISDYGNGYNEATGHYTIPSGGIYQFYINYEGSGDSQVLRLYKNGLEFEVLENKLVDGQIITISFILEFTGGDELWIKLNTGTGTTCGLGSFTGFRIH